MSNYTLNKDLKQFIIVEESKKLQTFLEKNKAEVFKEEFVSKEHMKSVWIQRFRVAYEEVNAVKLNAKNALLPEDQFFDAFFIEMIKEKSFKSSECSKKKVIYISNKNANDNDLEWIVGGEDFSEELRAYRKNAVEVALKNEAMDDKQFLQVFSQAINASEKLTSFFFVGC
ncbi:hypothetical protein BD560DRAFT_414411 [Blakeslea trispora]|nr:hypothetical protein BD560DRAFT_414411 [Blakeslea trispora]